MKEKIQEAITIAKTPMPVFCLECGELMYSPMAKLSIFLYGHCEVHLEKEHEINNLFKIVEIL